MRIESVGSAGLNWAVAESTWTRGGEERWVSTLDLDGRGRVGLTGPVRTTGPNGSGVQRMWTAQLSSAGELIPGCVYAPTDPETDEALPMSVAASGPEDGLVVMGRRGPELWLARIARP